MQCERTGAHIWIEPYGEWAVCDLFREGVIWVARISAVAFDPMRTYNNGDVLNADAWFDREKMAQLGRGLVVSTLIMPSTQFAYHGYEGIPVKDAKTRAALSGAEG